MTQYNLFDIIISCASSVYLWKSVYGYVDIISWTYWIYLMMDLPLDDVVNGLVWCVLRQWVSDYVTCCLVMLAKEYSGLGSMTFC